MVLLAIFLVTEKNDGTMLRNIVAGVSPTYNIIAMIVTGLTRCVFS